MHIVQKSAASVPESKIVFYKDGGVAAPLKPGYALCYDVTEDLTPQTGEFDELVRGNVVVRPTTANRELFAGIVKKIHKRTGTGTDYSGFVEIYTPKSGTFVKALVGVNSTRATTVMTPVNNQFYLGADASTDIASDYSRNSVGLFVDETDATLTATPANRLVMLLGI